MRLLLGRNGSFLSSFPQLMEWKDTVRSFIISKYHELNYDSSWLSSMKQKCAVLSERYEVLKALKRRSVMDLKVNISKDFVSLYLIDVITKSIL